MSFSCLALLFFFSIRLVSARCRFSQARDPRLKLCFVDQSFGVTINQARQSLP